MNAAAQALREAGFRVEPFRPCTLELLRKLWWKFFVQCGAMFYAPEIRGREHQLSPIFNEFFGIAEAAPPLTATELLNAWAELDLLRAKTLDEMSRFPVLLCPVASVPAFRHGERSWTIDGQDVEYLDAWRHTQWFNALAAPAAVVPVAVRRRACPSACRSSRGRLRMKRRWALRQLSMRRSAIARRRWRVARISSSSSIRHKSATRS